MKVLVDLDPMIYAICNTLEPTFYWVGPKFFEYKADAVKFCQKNDVDVEKIVKQQCLKEPFYVAAICKSYIENQASRTANVLGKHVPDTYFDFVWVLSSSINFRMDVDPEYKGNRGAKPYYRNMVRRVLQEQLGAVAIKGLEADDVIAMLQEQLDGESIICSVDKDLMNIPGKFYNPRKTSFLTISHFDGLTSFLMQCLTGDSVDNIKGIKSLGPKKAEKIVTPVADQYAKDGKLDLVWKNLEGEVLKNLPSLDTQKFRNDAALLDVGGYWCSRLGIQLKAAGDALKRGQKTISKILNS